MIEIDGSFGEGGGQVLRSSLALSMVRQVPVRIFGIRAGRERPGLLRQHLTAVLAAQAISGAEVRGAALNSRELEFWPGPVRAGDYHFAIGTAGSTLLVLQTILPALLFAAGSSTVTVEGGTHNPNAPTADFLREAWLPHLRAMGADLAVEVPRRGFFPAGGGRVQARVQGGNALQPIERRQRGALLGMRAVATLQNLSRTIAERELQVLAERLALAPESLAVETGDRGSCPGNALRLTIDSEGGSECFVGIGTRGLRAETLAENVAREALLYLEGDWPVGPHLADQLLLPLALAGGGAFRTGPLSQHTKTNAAIVERFLPVRLHTEEERSGAVLVSVLPRT